MSKGIEKKFEILRMGKPRTYNGCVSIADTSCYKVKQVGKAKPRDLIQYNVNRPRGRFEPNGEVKMRKSLGLILGFYLSAAIACAQGALSLQDYLGQVKSQGPDYQSAQAAVEGYEKQSHQQDLIYSPQLVASYHHTDDQSQQSSILAAQQTM